MRKASRHGCTILGARCRPRAPARARSFRDDPPPCQRHDHAWAQRSRPRPTHRATQAGHQGALRDGIRQQRGHRHCREQSERELSSEALQTRNLRATGSRAVGWSPRVNRSCRTASTMMEPSVAPHDTRARDASILLVDPIIAVGASARKPKAAASAWHRRLASEVERRMRRAVVLTKNLWGPTGWRSCARWEQRRLADVPRRTGDYFMDEPVIHELKVLRAQVLNRFGRRI